MNPAAPPETALPPSRPPGPPPPAARDLDAAVSRLAAVHETLVAELRVISAALEGVTAQLARLRAGQP